MEAGGPLLDDLTLFNELVARLDAAGYAQDDIDWAENVQPPADACEFAREAIFVICNSGMKHTIARQIYEKCLGAIALGESCSTVFGHEGKSRAMDLIWSDRHQLFADYMAAEDKIEFCKALPWIGGITCYHLAKNFGAQVAKPDVHLMRLADRHASTPQHLCETLAELTGYSVNTIDLILWRPCAVGILDGHTCTLVEKAAPAPEPQPYQEELFVPYQADLFA